MIYIGGDGMYIRSQVLTYFEILAFLQSAWCWWLSGIGFLIRQMWDLIHWGKFNTPGPRPVLWTDLQRCCSLQKWNSPRESAWGSLEFLDSVIPVPVKGRTSLEYGSYSWVLRLFLPGQEWPDGEWLWGFSFLCSHSLPPLWTTRSSLLEL